MYLTNSGCAICVLTLKTSVKHNFSLTPDPIDYKKVMLSECIWEYNLQSTTNNKYFYILAVAACKMRGNSHCLDMEEELLEGAQWITHSWAGFIRRPRKQVWIPCFFVLWSIADHVYLRFFFWGNNQTTIKRKIPTIFFWKPWYIHYTMVFLIQMKTSIWYYYWLDIWINLEMPIATFSLQHNWTNPKRTPRTSLGRKQGNYAFFFYWKILGPKQ